MLDKPISPLRQRMIEDMTARRFKEKVQKDYVRHVRSFAAFFGRSPDSATSEDVRRFQVHMAEQRIGVPSINSAIAALRFLCKPTVRAAIKRPSAARRGSASSMGATRRASFAACRRSARARRRARPADRRCSTWRSE